jgi:hypothetical protein
LDQVGVIALLLDSWGAQWAGDQTPVLE